LNRAVEWVRNDRNRRLGYGALAIVLAIFCFFPRPFVARAKVLPQDTSSAGLGAILNSLGGNLATFSSFLGNTRPPNDLYLIVARSDLVQQDVIKALNLVGPNREYDDDGAARRSLTKKVNVRLLLGGVLEVETRSFSPNEATQLTAAYVRAIGNRVGNLSRETLKRKRQILDQRFADTSRRLAQAERALDNFRRTNRLAAPEIQLGTEISLRAGLQGQLAAKQVELGTLQRFAGPENAQLISVQEAVRSLQAKIAASDPPSLGTAGPNVGGLNLLQSQYLNLFRDYRFAQSLYEIYTRASEQSTVESLAADSATYVQSVEPPHLDAERHYNILAVGMLGALVLLMGFTEVYVPLTGMRWRRLSAPAEADELER